MPNLISDKPSWGAIGSEPPDTKKTDGWEVLEKPPYNWFNWFWNRTSVAIATLDDNIISNPDAIPEFQFGTLGTRPTDVTTVDDGTIYITSDTNQIFFADHTQNDWVQLGAGKAIELPYDSSNATYLTANNVKSALDELDNDKLARDGSQDVTGTMEFNDYGINKLFDIGLSDNDDSGNIWRIIENGDTGNLEFRYGSSSSDSRFSLSTTTGDLYLGVDGNNRVWHNGNDAILFKKDGSRAMTGDLDLGGNYIKDAENIYHGGETGALSVRTAGIDGTHGFNIYDEYNSQYLLTANEGKGVRVPKVTLYNQGSAVLTQADEGSGNGLDADTVDGLHENDIVLTDGSNNITYGLTIDRGVEQGFLNVVRDDGTGTTNGMKLAVSGTYEKPVINRTIDGNSVNSLKLDKYDLYYDENKIYSERNFTPNEYLRKDGGVGVGDYQFKNGSFTIGDDEGTDISAITGIVRNDTSQPSAMLRLMSIINEENVTQRFEGRNSVGERKYADIQFNPVHEYLSINVPYTAPVLKVHSDGTAEYNNTEIETVIGSQSKADTAENNAKSYTDNNFLDLAGNNTINGNLVINNDLSYANVEILREVDTVTYSNFLAGGSSGRVVLGLNNEDTSTTLARLYVGEDNLRYQGSSGVEKDVWHNGNTTYDESSGTDQQGSLELPNGMIMKWGWATDIATNANRDITFDNAFPNDIIMAQSDGSAGTGKTVTVDFESGFTDRFGLRVENSSDSSIQDGHWFAIGY